MSKQPTFPAPPAVLNPLNPNHYGLLLLLWIYFQPSKLKHYLHQALICTSKRACVHCGQLCTPPPIVIYC